jgi:hypothetical protein
MTLHMRKFTEWRASGYIFLIVLLTFSGTAHAQEGQGAPAELIGTYGKSPLQCRSHHRKSDDIHIIGKNQYSFCGGSACGFDIKSHRKQGKTFIITGNSAGNPIYRELKFEFISSDIVEIYSNGNNRETLVRCTDKDAISGIGQPSVEVTPMTQGDRAIAAAYAAYYAQHIPHVCPNLKIDKSPIDSIISSSKFIWADFANKVPWRKGSKVTRGEIEDIFTSADTDAYQGIKKDAESIPNFCLEALRAFGVEGRIIRNVIVNGDRRI